MRLLCLTLLVSALILAPNASAQGLSNALVLEWSQSVGGYSAEVEGNIIFLGVGDINDDDYGEVVVVIGGSKAVSDPTEKNRVYTFTENGTPLWSIGFDNEINDAILYDIDRDGHTELIVATGQEIQKIARGTVEVIKSNGDRSNKMKFNSIIRSLTVSDFEDDKYYEIIGGARNIIFVFDRMGSIRWDYRLSGSPPPDPHVVVDSIRSGSEKHILVAAYKIRLLNTSGELDFGELPVESVTGKTGDRVDKIVVGKLLPTSGKQILFSTRRSDLLYAYGLEWTEKKRYEYVEKWVLPLDAKITSLEVADLDGEGGEEIVFADEKEMLYTLGGDGKVRWSYKVRGRITDTLVADVNNDFKLEVIAASTSGVIYVLDAEDGSLIWDYSIQEPIGWIEVGKLDADNINELIVGTLHRNIHVFSVNKSYTELYQANAYYQLGQRYFVEGKYNESLKYLLNAKELYIKYESRGEILRVEELIRTIDEAISVAEREKAGAYYDKAVQFFIDENYKQSKAIALEAKVLYEGFGDTRNALKVELLLMRIDERLSGVIDPTETTLPENTTVVVGGETDKRLGYTVIFVLVLVITIVLLKTAYKRKRAASKQESADVKEYEKRLEAVLDQDIDELKNK